MLKGYRTYLVGAAIGLTAALHYMGLLSEQLYQAIQTVLLGGGLAALRASKTI